MADDLGKGATGAKPSDGTTRTATSGPSDTTGAPYAATARSPVSRERRFVVVTRRPGAAASFGQPTTLVTAHAEARAVEDRKVGIYELVLVKP